MEYAKEVHMIVGTGIRITSSATAQLGCGTTENTSSLIVQDGSVNQTVQLNGELAAGMYLMNITAGTVTFSERLIDQPKPCTLFNRNGTPWGVVPVPWASDRT